MQCPDTNRLIRYLLVKLAPVILGVKPAGLLRLTDCRQTGGKQHDLFCLHQPEILAALQLRCRILRRNSENLVVFFFREGALERVLSEPHNAEFLAGRGYRRGAELAELEFRCRNGSGFPHEIGVFLGYPLKDVRCYIENPNACLTLPRGLWRVAGEPAESLAVMERFRRAESAMRQVVGCGRPLEETLRDIHNLLPAA